MKLFEDLPQLRLNEVPTLIKHIKQSMNADVTIVKHSSQNSNQRHLTQFTGWLLNVCTSLLSISPWKVRLLPSLPHPNASTSVRRAISVPTTITPQCTLYLLSSVHCSRDRILLLQDSLEVITTDQALFKFMKWRLSRRRNRLLLHTSLRYIQGIHFTKVGLVRHQVRAAAMCSDVIPVLSSYVWKRRG